MLSESRNHGSCSLPGVFGSIIGLDTNGVSLALASGMLMVTVFRPVTFVLSQALMLPLRVTTQEKVSFLPKRL